MRADGLSQPPNARRLRPNMAAYGVSPDATADMLAWHWVATRLAEARNYWLCTTRPSGQPHAVPIWAVWFEDALYFGSERQSQKFRNIQHCPQALVHLESGDEVVIFEGALVACSLTAALARAYQEKYSFDPSAGNEAAQFYCLKPQKVMAWRESAFPATVTYWLFDA